MYLYVAPRGGFNDQLCVLYKAIQFCIKTNRTLLIDTTQCCYKINFSDYFYFKDLPITIISNIDEIADILKDTSLSIYPPIFKNRDPTNWKFVYKTYNWVEETTNTYLPLPNHHVTSQVIVYVSCGCSENGCDLLPNLFFKDNIINHVKSEFSKLPSKYLSIQIRNTDRKCNYRELYEKNKDTIHSYEAVYIATDDRDSLDFFKDKGLKILNFTEFPDKKLYNLHYSNISGDTKIKNVITDIYIMVKADVLLSNSIGGFIDLVRNIRKNRSMLNL